MRERRWGKDGRESEGAQGEGEDRVREMKRWESEGRWESNGCTKTG